MKEKKVPRVDEIMPTPPPVEQSTYKYGFGWVMKDVITGFVGAVVYRCDNITGCNQYGLAPTKRKHGSETKHIDESRLTWTGEVIQLPITAEQLNTDKPGGVSGLGSRM